MKYLIGIAILIAVGIAGFQFDWVGKPDGQDVALGDALFTVRRDDLTITVVEEGSLKAKNSLKLSSQFESEGVISWLIDEGTEVKEDDILVEFEKTDVQNEIDELENSMIQYKTELDAAKAELEIQKRDNVASLEKAELGLDMARKKLERYEKGDAPNEKRKLELALTKARAALRRAEERFAEVPELQKAGYLTKIQAEEEALRVEEAQFNVENAEEDLKLFKTYTYDMEMAQKKADVRDAERTLENAKEKADIHLKEKQARVTRQDRRVQSTQNRLDKYRKELEQMTMKAPQPGIVHYGASGREWERERIKVGGRIWRGITVITLPDLSEMQVICQVHETEIDKVKLGMKVTVTVEAVQDQIFEGEVTKIAAVASAHWSDKSNKRFEVEITLGASDVELRAGITAKAEIQVEVVPGVLMVPIHAVFTEEGERFCFVRDNGDVLKRNVEIGKNSAHYVEIVKGLDEGERVLLLDPRENGLFDGKESGDEGEEVEGNQEIPEEADTDEDGEESEEPPALAAPEEETDALAEPASPPVSVDIAQDDGAGS
jgi:HlyD family secretion protein